MPQYRLEICEGTEHWLGEDGAEEFRIVPSFAVEGDYETCVGFLGIKGTADQARRLDVATRLLLCLNLCAGLTTAQLERLVSQLPPHPDR